MNYRLNTLSISVKLSQDFQLLSNIDAIIIVAFHRNAKEISESFAFLFRARKSFSIHSAYTHKTLWENKTQITLFGV